MKSYRLLVLSAALALIVCAVSADTLIEKPPDQGPFWQPLSPNGGSYVYADCFIAPAAPDTLPLELGTWLQDLTAAGGQPPKNSSTGGPAPLGGTPDVRFEIWGDAGGPDAGNVLATTGTLSPLPVGLEFFSAPVLGGASDLTPGNLYWFAATVVGEAGTGSFQVGGHTQNSSFPDNCTFWFSNDPAGISFDGTNFVPEMAFSVNLGVMVPVELQTFGIDSDE